MKGEGGITPIPLTATMITVRLEIPEILSGKGLQCRERSCIHHFDDDGSSQAYLGELSQDHSQCLRMEYLKEWGGWIIEEYNDGHSLSERYLSSNETVQVSHHE